MRASRFTLSTLKEIPADAEIPSHRLMLRAGLIRKLAAGLYSWMPMGLRVLHKIEQIVREEMDRAGAQELLMPTVQPAELWQESGRWDKYEHGLLLKMLDRHDRQFCFGPTHEEVITDIARNELQSYRQLPVCYYQIQTKFRDETRPRFGVMRAREFIMKDAYSFHLDQPSLDATFDDMYQAYSATFSRMGLDFRPVHADPGSIGGTASIEFHIIAATGEDEIAFSDASDYAANVELATTLQPQPAGQPAAQAPAMETIETPDCKSIEAITSLLDTAARQTAKTLIVRGSEHPLVALVLRGDHELNPIKAEKQAQVLAPLTFADVDEVRAALGCDVGFIGPVGLADKQIPLVIDHDVAALEDFICGANENDRHLRHVHWHRDAPLAPTADLRKVCPGDASPDGNGNLQIARGIEVGHIFKLGDDYSRPMQASVLDESGRAQPMIMGCYGIGVSRLAGAIIEQHHDDAGIVWPESVAPFRVILIPINAHRSETVRQLAEQLYARLGDAGIEVLLDDRDNVRPGAKFADAELLGIPHRVVIGERSAADGQVEYTSRSSGASEPLTPDALLTRLGAT